MKKSYHEAINAANSDMSGWVSQAITDDRENWSGETSGIYLVRNIDEVRSALVEDYENGFDRDEDVSEFLDRHKIAWQ